MGNKTILTALLLTIFSSHLNAGFFDLFCCCCGNDSTEEHQDVESQSAAEVTRRILSFQAKPPSFQCSVFHYYDARGDGGDPACNLYAKNGVLEKFDLATGKHSQAYEGIHNYVPIDDVRRSTFGYDTAAAQVSVCLRRPLASVTYNGVTFSPEDIEGLLCLVIETLAPGVDFRGDRYYGPDDDFRPNDFLQSLQDFQRLGRAFILQRDDPYVVQYVIDEFQVVEIGEAPSGLVDFPPSAQFFRVHLRGPHHTGEQNDWTFYFWIDENSDQSEWIRSPKASPFFPTSLWQPSPRGDLQDPRTWVGISRANPEVDAATVFNIYRHSLRIIDWTPELHVHFSAEDRAVAEMIFLIHRFGKIEGDQAHPLGLLPKESLYSLIALVLRANMLSRQ